MTANLENRITRERIVIRTATPELLRIEEQAAVDMIPPPVHVHLHQHERFEVLQGQVTVQLRRERHVLQADMSLVVAPRTPHTWRNSGETELRMLTEFTPAGNMLSFFEAYCGFAREGRTDDNGAAPFLAIAAACRHWDMYLATPPVALQKVLFAVLGPLARRRGYERAYSRFQIADAQPATA
jgi:mannose-6-phosphate isomerase-like protein (cupin superfamily)